MDAKELKPCQGMNCGCTDGMSHSPECFAEHAATIAGGRFVKSDAAQAPIGEVVDFRETAFASIPVIAWDVKPELGAKLYAAPVAPAAAAPCTECGGSASIKCQSKHCPQAAQPDERAAFEAWAKDQGFPIGQSDVGDGLSYLDLRTQGAFDAWQARATVPQAMTPESTADAIDAVFRRRLELLIQNLTVSDKNEITWMAISCRGVVQSLYPRKGS